MSFFNQKQKTGIDQKMLQTEFAELFGPLMPSVRKLKRFGHIGSFATQAMAIYKISESSLSGMQKGYMILFSLVITLFLAALIEGGIAKVGPIWFRQIIRFKFKNKWFVGMFLIITAFILPLAFFSPFLSGNGALHSIEELTPQVQRTNTLHIETLFQEKQNSFISEFNSQRL